MPWRESESTSAPAACPTASHTQVATREMPTSTELICMMRSIRTPRRMTSVSSRKRCIMKGERKKSTTAKHAPSPVSNRHAKRRVFRNRWPFLFPKQ